MIIHRSARGRNVKRSWLSVLGILATLLSLLFNPGAGRAQAGASGTVFAWGSNFEGQAHIPPGLSDVTAISAGNVHSLALKGDGTVVAWGCVTKDNAACTVPAGLSGVTAISAGANHNLALKNDGTVVAWGNNTSGQTNVPAELSGVTAIAGGGWHSLALKGDGTVGAWGNNGFGQVNVPPGLSGVIAISAGTYHSLALKDDGTIIAWGHNTYEQSTVPADLSGVIATSGGHYHSLALKSDGTVVAWGRNSSGQASIPAGLSGVTAISAGISHNLVLKGDGTVIAWGDNTFDKSSVPAGLSGVIAIAAGDSHSLALAQTVPARHYPVALDDSYSTNANTALTVAAPGVLSNDTDEDVDPLTARLLNGPAHGTLTLNDNGSFTYTLAADYAGVDGFTYRAFDRELSSNIAKVSITVSQTNNAPVALDQSLTTPRNTPLAITLTATDVENSALTYTIVTGPTNGALSGAAPVVTYTPNVGYAGPDSFTFKANDGAADSNVATVNISVLNVARHPVALNDSYSTTVNTALTVAAPGVLSNDTDENGDTLSALLVSGPAHGTLALNFNGAFGYTPATNYAGQDSFTYRAFDGELSSDIATVSITVSQASQYSFAGFFEPVKNPGPGPRYVFNSVRAGSAVPLKFSLAGDQGLDIFAAGFPTSQPVSCALLKSSSGTMRAVTAGSSSLSYDPITDQYTYVWKTDKKWAGKCRVLTVQLDDGTPHLAYFQFK